MDTGVRVCYFRDCVGDSLFAVVGMNDIFNWSRDKDLLTSASDCLGPFAAMSA